MKHGRKGGGCRRPNLAIYVLVYCLVWAILSFGLPHAGTAGGFDAAAAGLKTSKQLKIGVIGDSLAIDLWYGMKGLLRGRDEVAIVKFAKPATGLIRDDVYDWQDALRSFLRKNRVDVIAVIIGGNDRQSVRIGGRRLERGSQAWFAEYERRVAGFMHLLEAGEAQVYWVGLPAVSSGRMSRDYQSLNRIFRNQAAKHGFSYVSTWEAFVDSNGRYSSFGRGLDGTKRRLRKDDGMHFTTDGQLRLADTVVRAVNRDLAGLN